MNILAMMINVSGLSYREAGELLDLSRNSVAVYCCKEQKTRPEYIKKMRAIIELQDAVVSDILTKHKELIVDFVMLTPSPSLLAHYKIPSMAVYKAICGKILTKFKLEDSGYV